MTVSPDTLAKQQAYAARPWAARLETSHFGGTFRFDTEAEALDYLTGQVARLRRECKAKRNEPNWYGFDAWRSHIEGPNGYRYPAALGLQVDSFDNRNWPWPDEYR